MLTLARGIEVRYSKTQIFVTKFAFQGVICCSIKYNSRFVVGGTTVKKIKLCFKHGSNSA